jgi:DNA-binding response OmpR family regulator
MSGLSILVVDDDHDFAESLAELLHERGHEVELAFTGEDGVRELTQGHFDITFMDVKLPDMSGVDSFLESRKHKAAARVVMMTGYMVEEMVQKAVAAGALGVLRKPLVMSELFSFLDQIAPDRTLLLVDDDAEFLASTKAILVDRGFRVLAARTGVEAVELALANTIDLLILDLRLPLLNGLGVYQELKRQGMTLPTIVVTAYPVEECEQVDALGVLPNATCMYKPFDPAVLLSHIDELISA